jgi:uncharacterized protein YgiM (DUF1202 family)
MYFDAPSDFETARRAAFQEVKAVEPLTNENSASTEIRTKGKETGKVAIVLATPDGYLNLRSTPNTDGEVLDSAYRGDKVIVLEYRIDWSKVRFHGKIGFMSTPFLKSLDN